MKFNVLAFALAFGIWWGIGIFLATWWLIATGGSNLGAVLLEQLYVGYSVTPLGSVVGLVWGAVCGAVCGAILAWLYNVLAARLGRFAPHLTPAER